ncbi:hypothetical protein DFQ28_010563 [Apophysomyces sp. BC1034]|nr:hypothetical protein DFQ30_001557 [Apophysomyces sp. BC1015]KAG0183519.1 hypothetical protein DFQ29_002573 [Apophysomyces sp. BC1021]KAG0194479.1 hypothetical protein DFQ28_010563 [Apophysomyces sp. BC1034]
MQGKPPIKGKPTSSGLSNTSVKVYFDNDVDLECIIHYFYDEHILPDIRDDVLETLLEKYRIHLEQVQQIKDIIRNLQASEQRSTPQLQENEAITQTEEAHCRDDIEIVQEMHKQTATYQISEKVESNNTPDKLRDDVDADLYHSFYELKIAQLAVQSYLDDMLRTLPSHSRLTDPDPDEKQQDMITLMKILDTLFAAERSFNTGDDGGEGVAETFLENVRTWLIYVAAIYLQLSDITERRFLLLHLLRTHTISWGMPLLQYSFVKNCAESAFLDEYIMVLQLILNYDLYTKTNESPRHAPWNEDDHLAALDQLAVVHTYCVTMDAALDQLHSDVDSSKLSRFIHFSGSLIGVMNAAIRTFAVKGQTSLTKRLAQIACQAVQILSEKSGEGECVDLCQVHMDEAVRRISFCYLDARETNIWNFLPSLPYYAVSISTLWQIALRLLHIDQMAEFESLSQLLDNLPTITEYLEFLGANQIQGIFMLSCLSNIAISLPTDSPDSTQEESVIYLLAVIAHTLFTVAFVDNNLREVYYKDVRDHFKPMCRRHPIVVSLLLRWTYDHFSTMEGMALYLFHSLPLSRWTVTQDDLGFLRQLLCQGPSASVSTNFARYVIQNLNLGYHPERDDSPSKSQPWCKRKKPFLSYEVHEKLAFLLLDACQKYRPLQDTEKNADLIRVVASTVSTYFPIIDQDLPTATSTAEFLDWAWATMLALKLYDCPISSRATEIEESVTISILRDTLHNHVDTVASHGALLTYVLFLLSPTSRHFLRFEAGHGWMKLLLIFRRGKPEAVVQILSETIPAFVYMHGDDFFNDETLSEFVRQMIYCKADPLLVNAVSKRKEGLYWEKRQATGIGMIIGSHAWQGQFIDSVSNLMDDFGHGFSYFDLMLHSWLKTVFRKSDWMWHKQYVAIVDCLCKIAFTFGRYRLARRMLAEEQKKLEQRKLQQILGSSTLSALRNDHQRSPLRFIKNIIPDSAYTSLLTGEWSMLSLTTNNLFRTPGIEYSSLWFVFEVLMLETKDEQEYRQSLAKYVAQCAAESEIDIATHFKTFDSQQKKLPEFYCIYRWAQHILVLPPDHPLLPLFLQMFFCLYFSCFTVNSDTYFYGHMYFTKKQDLLNKLRDHIAQIQTRHGQYQAMEEKERPLTNSGIDHEKLRQVYYAMWIWIGGTDLLSKMDISSLPNHYCPDLLALCCQPSTFEQWETHQPWNDTNATWFDLVNSQHLQDVFRDVPWQGSMKFRNNIKNNPSISSETHRTVAKSIIVERAEPPPCRIRRQNQIPLPDDLLKLTEEELLAPILEML